MNVDEKDTALELEKVLEGMKQLYEPENRKFEINFSQFSFFQKLEIALRILRGGTIAFQSSDMSAIAYGSRNTSREKSLKEDSE